MIDLNFVYDDSKNYLEIEVEHHNVSFPDGELSFMGRRHGSVGINYNIVFDKSEFDGECSCQYLHPEQMRRGDCGADDSVLTWTLKPLKKGTFLVYEYLDFRGEITNFVKNIITVE